MRFARLIKAALPLFAVAGTVSCSDPAPPTADGAWQVSFQAADADPNKCPVMSHNVGIGAISATSRDQVVIDQGPEGASLVCSVVGSDTFEVQANISQADKGLEFVIHDMSAAASQTSPALGAATFVSALAVNGYASQPDAPCEFYFEPGTKESIAPGRIWVSFTCPKITDGGATGSLCQIKKGYAIFENCTQE
jgi:hypothetical protein